MPLPVDGAVNALLFLTFLVMLFSNITAWYFRIGIRVGYYVVPLMLWLAAVSLHLLSSRLTVPRSISSLIVLRGLWMACIVLTAPLVLLDQSPEAFEILGKGAAEELVISIALTLMMLLVTQLDGVQRRRLLDLYLLGAALLAFLSLAQVVGPVVFGFDVDAWVSSVLRQGSRPAVSLAEDSMGILGATLFRMRGTTSDPNVNGLIFALALPVVYLRARERSAVGMTLLMVLFATVIVGTISTTMISAATLTIAAMTARSLARPGSRAMGAAGLA
ncbi:MAG: hypothetical protein FJ202_06770, partial [Gemmatimonadetes bacterium]|nr:hypothetical protein [Gemmatimonadota bacterium]